MSSTATRRPSAVASRLGISVSTLRRWSQQFSPFLSTMAQQSDEDGGRHRRYADEDLATLISIKTLLSEGFTYDQVRARLQALEDDGDVAVESYALVAGSEPMVMAPAVAVLSDTLHTVADGQQLLLNSQQANRDLISVAIQDNFNLKAENTKLRDRMLDLERSLSEVKRHEAARYEGIEARLRAVEDTLDALIVQTQVLSEQRRRGLRGLLFGD
jgi:DNA-binding transcriptional MerR regulator